MSLPDDVVSALATIEAACADLDADARIEVYNATVRAAAGMVRDVTEDPACSPQLLPAAAVRGNDYNPNRVATPELELLEESMRADGITMAVVVMANGSGRSWTVVDGFHRRTVAAERLGRSHIPCAVIDRPLADRMASTVRHNRARGKHQVDLMASLVKAMMDEGWDDARIAESLGMSQEELLRLRQMVGAARLLAGTEYSRSWGR